MPAITKLQDKQFVLNVPAVEIDKACNEIRLMLKEKLSWVSHPYHIAQKFYTKTEKGVFYYPETYLPSPDSLNYSYHRLTPDNDYSGMFFFMVGTGRPLNYEHSQQNFITYPVSIIFSANLKLIDNARLVDYLYTQDLIKSARRALTDFMVGFDFQYKITGESRDLKEVYKEFTLDDIENYNRAPLQCFRIDLSLTLQEEC